MTVQFFSRLYISCQTRDGDLDNFFKHENQGCPPSLSQNGRLRLPSKKSDLLDTLSNITPASTNVSSSYDAMVLDGAALVNMLKPTSTVKTFADYSSEVFLAHIENKLQRVDVVFDEYIPNSLKATRSKRGGGVRRREQSSTMIPKNWNEFLRLDANKTELFGYLAEQVALVQFRQGSQVIVTKGQQVVCNPLSCDTVGLSQCNHEEADTRMVVHVNHAVHSGYRRIAVRTVDTDVVVIFTAAVQSLPNTEIYILFGVGAHYRTMAIHEISRSLGPPCSDWV